MKTFIDIVSKANTFTLEKEATVRMAPSLEMGLIFRVDNNQLGFVKPEAAQCFLKYSNVFQTDEERKYLVLSPVLDTPLKRTMAIHEMLQDLRSKKLFTCLDGWRDESFQVFGQTGVLFELERSAIGLLGVRAAGCHLNGYVLNSDGSIKMWVARRSFTKQTYPGLLDNIVGGI